MNSFIETAERKLLREVGGDGGRLGVPGEVQGTENIKTDEREFLQK